MGTKQNLEVFEQLREAQRNRDWSAYAALLTDDCVFRMAGVPRAMGGVTEGKDAIKAFFENTPAGSDVDVKKVIADDNHVVAIQRLSAPTFVGSDVFKGGNRPFSTYECVVYRFENGKLAESTAYVNWADVYVQTGVLDVASMLA